jgi:hypothetical protein
MIKRTTLFTGLSLFVVLIFFLNLIASKLYWYSSIWWLDILMHFLGGFWLGLVFLWIFYKDLSNQNLKKEIFFKVILGVAVVGIGWEFYQIMVNNLFAKNAFDLLDTLGDIINDLLGGVMAYYLFNNISKKD